MNAFPNVASVAFLIGDPTRAIMLAALMDGRALPAGELAYAAGITAQTASSHLSKLLAGGLLSCESEGRHRYYRLVGPDVAHALEHLAAISRPVRRKPLTRQAQDLHLARCCYDHLAGQLGVAVTAALVTRHFLVPASEKRYSVTPAGVTWFGALGVPVAELVPTRRGIARQCLDWTERTHHLAGPLGVRLMGALCESKWLRRTTSSRLVQVTPNGWAKMKEQLGIDEQSFSGSVVVRA
ncbi:MAG: helix-turn-helix transcriptional regulator [Paralcaligenes sp.]